MRHVKLQIVSRGIRLPPEAQEDPVARARPYTRVAPRSAASHVTAAQVWELPLLGNSEEETKVHISRPANVAAPRRKGVIGHQSKLFSGEVVYVDGMYVTSRERTWLDLAERLTVKELVVIADHLIRIPRPDLEDRRGAFSSKDDLQRLLSKHRGKKGIRSAREALKLAGLGLIRLRKQNCGWRSLPPAFPIRV